MDPAAMSVMVYANTNIIMLSKLWYNLAIQRILTTNFGYHYHSILELHLEFSTHTKNDKLSKVFGIQLCSYPI